MIFPTLGSRRFPLPDRLALNEAGDDVRLAGGETNNSGGVSKKVVSLVAFLPAWRNFFSARR